MRNELKKFIDGLVPGFLSDLSAPPEVFKIQYEIEAPKVKAHGDLAINIGLKLGKLLRRNPFEIAELFTKVINEKLATNQNLKNSVKSVKVEKPGFINFTFTENYLATELLNITGLNEVFGKIDFGKAEKVLIEFVSANPTGPLTIAHGRQAAIGDTLARILTAAGYQVHKEFYLNDGGRQIRLLGESLWVRYQELFNLTASIPEDGYRGQYLIDLAKELKKEKCDSLLKLEKVQALEVTTHYAVENMMSTIVSDLKDMDVVFDFYFSEKTLYEKAMVEKVLNLLKDRGLTYESEGALWFCSTRFGDDKDRVLKKQTGEYTYLTPDIAYHQSKFERGFTKLINLWGPDHHGYIPRLKAACEALGYKQDQINVLIVQLTTLFRNGEPVRMSTRAGEFVTLRELMDEVGPDAARFFFLMRKIESHLDFDLELAKKKSDDNPVYYLQYAHARISSILSYSGFDLKDKSSFETVDLGLIRETEELELIKKMIAFPQAIKESAEMLEPYRIVDYLRELAAAFHKFYALHRVVSDDPQLTKARLLVVWCVRIVLRNGLCLLGVNAPVKM